MKALVCLFILLIALSILFNGIHAYSQEALVPLHVVVLYLPNSDIDKLSQKLAERGMDLYYIPVELDGPRNYDYYLYWMITGTKPRDDYEMDKYPYIHVDQGILAKMWNRTVFIDVPLVDPFVHNASLNPLYNLTNNFISPRIFEIPINGSVYWDELETSISTMVNLSGVTISLDKFNRTYTISTVGESTGPTVVEIYNSTILRDGGYYIMLRLVNITSDQVVLFSPGIVSDSGWASPRFGKISGYNVHWSLLSRDMILQLDNNTLEWWFNHTLITMDNYLATAITVIGVPVYFAYAPHIDIAKKNIPSQVLGKIEDDIYYWVVDSINRTIATRLANCTFIVFNPFSDQGKGYLAYINAKPLVNINTTMTASQFVSLILSLSRAYPISFQLILDEMFNARAEAAVLSLRIKELESTVNNLNSTIASLNASLAFCESERNLLDARVKAIDIDLKRAEDLYRTIYTYITLGLIVTLVVGVSLGILMIRSVSKAHVKR